MTERDSLYAAVLAEPDSDLPRLVFADWCDDHGEPERAEFIRVQVQLARLPADALRRVTLLGRDAELLATNRDRWKLPGIRGAQGFVRGFVERWDGTGEWLLAAAGRLFDGTLVQSVRVRNADIHLPAIARLPGLAQVVDLNLYGNSVALHGRLGRLLRDARLTALRSLDIGHNRLVADDLPQLTGSPVARQLTALALSGNPLGYPTADDGMAALAGIRTLPNLRTLALRNNEQPDVDSLHAHGVEQLARSDNFPHLERLDLAGHRVGAAGLQAVLAGRLSERLTDLDLSNNDLGIGGERWAADLADLAGRRRPLLRRLALGGRRNRVSRQTVADLLAWVGRGETRTLDLTRAVLTPAAHAAVLRSPAAGRIHTDPPPLEAVMLAGLYLTLALAAPPDRLTATEKDPPAELSADVRAALDHKAVVLGDADGDALTVWFRTTLPLEVSAEVLANGVGYRELPPGTLVGAVKLHRPFTDFRKQRVAAGVYTLRFAVQPEVGDHAGTSPHPEFLLLSPASADESPARVEQPALLAMSRKATAADHPSVMLLAPAGGATESPKVVEKGGGLRVLLVKRPAEADGAKTTLNLGLVVSGVSPTR